MTDWPHAPFPPYVDLDPLGHLPEHRHVFDAKSVWAIRAALGAKRPLLLRGEPGTGKSELGRAAAAALGRAFVSEVITSRTEAQDLHWRFDAVARLGKAQILAARGSAPTPGRVGSNSDLDPLDEQLFVQPGPLWWVFDWKGAEDQLAKASVKTARHAAPPNWEPKQGSVLLIDEIDKADSDVPNGLLESLGNGEFHVPYFSESVRSNPKHPAPLVIITTNEERELPAAFVRRCLVLALELPKGAELLEFLIGRGEAHFGKNFSRDVYELAAQVLVADREHAPTDGLVRPGQAEYLDLLRATLEVAGTDPEKQREVIGAIQSFAFDKNPLATE